MTLNAFKRMQEFTRKSAHDSSKSNMGCFEVQPLVKARVLCVHPLLEHCDESKELLGSIFSVLSHILPEGDHQRAAQRWLCIITNSLSMLTHPVFKEESSAIMPKDSGIQDPRLQYNCCDADATQTNNG